MNTADRIQQLRKAKGISQETLADQIGVSRQAVSKWESEQATPDVEKIILLSDYFGVTTDYLLKGIEPVSGEEKRGKPDGRVFAIAATALNFIGLIAAVMIWYEKQTAEAPAVGLILMTVGCMIFGIGMTVAEERTKAQAKSSFWAVNVWLLPFMPLSLIYNILCGNWATAPYPAGGFPVVYLLFWVVYIALGVAGVCMARRNTAEHRW